MTPVMVNEQARNRERMYKNNTAAEGLSELARCLKNNVIVAFGRYTQHHTRCRPALERAYSCFSPNSPRSSNGDISGDESSSWMQEVRHFAYVRRTSATKHQEVFKKPVMEHRLMMPWSSVWYITPMRA